MLLDKHETETKISSFEYKRVVASKLAIPTALSILTFFPIYNYVLHNPGAALVMSMALITYLILTPIFYKQYGLIFVGRFSLFVLYICIFLLMYDLKADNYFTVWVFCYLLYALVLHGHVWGTILSAIFICIYHMDYVPLSWADNRFAGNYPVHGIGADPALHWIFLRKIQLRNL